MNKHLDVGFDWGHGKTVEEKWERFDQVDLRQATFPEGSAWRPIGKYLESTTTLRKDSVRVPNTLEPGNYVLGWRWDGADISQVDYILYFMIRNMFYFSIHRFGCPALQ